MFLHAEGLAEKTREHLQGCVGPQACNKTEMFKALNGQPNAC